MLNVFIIDDEIEGINALEINLSFCEVKTNVVGKETDSRTALQLLKKLEIDVLFWDIEMPGLNGIAFLEKLADRNFEVVMVTAFDSYAIKAIKVNTTDYLLKPVDVDELCKALKKIEEKRKQPTPPSDLGEKLDSISQLIKTAKQESPKIMLNSTKEIHYIAIDQIIRIQGESNHCNFFLTNDTKIMVAKTLKEFEETLLEHQFYRIHKSHIINLNHMIKLNKGFDFYVVMSDNSKLEVSHRRKVEFLKYLGSF